MRKIFGMATGVAIAGATLFGAVFAWSVSSTSAPSTATVGSNAITVAVAADSAALLGPNNDTAVDVGNITVTNAGSFILSGYTADIVLGTVTPDVAGTCAASDFTETDVLALTPISTVSDVMIATDGTAPADCQGDTLSYTVNVTAYN